MQAWMGSWRGQVPRNANVDTAEIPEWIITNTLAGNGSSALAPWPVRRRFRRAQTT
jgi:hypothetical protein